MKARGQPESAGLALAQSDLPLRLVHQGKVRDVYEVDAGHLLLVASDRVSAFDVVMEQAIPRKGEVLTQLSAWWLDQLDAASPHHLVSAHPATVEAAVPALGQHDPAHWARRSMLVRRTQPFLVECVVRGYVAGSAWKEYAAQGTLAGEPLPAGLEESQALPHPIFSPATKAQEGHDENITFGQAAERLGTGTAEALRARSLELYAQASAVAAEREILLADTKFEFGRDAEGRILLIDEVLTPDSSRYWPKAHYAIGRGQPSLDKQPVRDFLDGLDWNKQPPPPALPGAVVEATTGRYLDVFRRLTGTSLDDWDPPEGGGA